MNILMFNWRDIRNPQAGGAEVFTHENTKRWVKKGHTVTIFCSAFKGCKKEETIDNVHIVRKGGRFSVYLHAQKFYRKDAYDIVIDQINTIPFFTPFFVKERKIAMIHQLAREFWFCEMPVIGLAGYLLEPLYMRLYSGMQTVTVSDSTKKDLISLGFEDISIVSEGIDFKPLDSLPEKEKDFTMIFVGRMKTTKKPMDAIKAYRNIKKKIPSAKLWMVGDGPEKFPEIDGVTYFGRVSGEKKRRLMSSAHLILVPAVREGWGLVVTEANAMGTPAVAYDVPGLRDSVKHKITGLLCDPNPESMADTVFDLHTGSHLQAYSENALENSHNYTWDRSAEEFLQILECS